MSTSTTNLSLTKQAANEYYSIDVVNTNLDKIDSGCVNVSQAQDITGYKKFISSITRKATNVNMSTTPSSQETAVHFDGLDNNNTPIVRFRTYHETSGASELSIIIPKQGWDGNADYQQPRLRMISSTGGTIQLSLSKANQTYNSSATELILTVGLLQASTDVVHTTGNETIAGNKNFTDNILVGTYGKIYPYSDSNGKRLLLSALNSNNVEGRLELRMNEDGSVILYLRRFAGGTPTDVTIATIPA